MRWRWPVAGFPFNAVELTPKFAEILATQASSAHLPIRVIAENIFEATQTLRRDYRLFFASEVVPDFRGPEELRRLFEIAADVLEEDGTLLFNVHLAAQGFTPDKAAREFAQQCYSALFTANEVRQAFAGLPFELVSNDSVHDYEHDNLPEQAWPPTPWFVNWVTGLDVYDIEQHQCPVELRWLTFRRTQLNGCRQRHWPKRQHLTAKSGRSVNKPRQARPPTQVRPHEVAPSTGSTSHASRRRVRYPHTAGDPGPVGPICTPLFCRLHGAWAQSDTRTSRAW